MQLARQFARQTISVAAMVAILALALYGCLAFSSSDSGFLDGFYEGYARGYRGFIHVQVRMEGGRIAEIELVSSDEDPFMGGEAIEELLDLVVAYNTTNLDAVAGATVSSMGFLQAVENAILNRGRP